jgi:hypothetical protein
VDDGAGGAGRQGAVDPVGVNAVLFHVIPDNPLAIRARVRRPNRNPRRAQPKA